jgi:hypothetical protein
MPFSLWFIPNIAAFMFFMTPMPNIYLSTFGKNRLVTQLTSPSGFWYRFSFLVINYCVLHIKYQYDNDRKSGNGTIYLLILALSSSSFPPLLYQLSNPNSPYRIGICNTANPASSLIYNKPYENELL